MLTTSSVHNQLPNVFFTRIRERCVCPRRWTHGETIAGILEIVRALKAPEAFTSTRVEVWDLEWVRFMISWLAYVRLAR